MPPAAAGGGVAGCVLRVILVWTVPVVAAASGYAAGDLVWGTSALAACLEALFCVCSQSKDLRRLGNSARLVPFPLRFVVLIALQLWCVVIASAIPDAEPASGIPSRSSADASWAHQASDAAASVGYASNSGNLRAGSGSSSGSGGSGSGAAEPERAPATQTPSPVPAPVPPAPPTGSSGGGAVSGGGAAPFIVDADPATLVWKPKTISVVLPCAEEREYAVKTVQSIYHTTPREVLQEIIVVDDGSEPPLSDKLLSPAVQRQYNVRVLRHDRTVGLIGAKKTGGDAMVGDIGVFFDCHVAPQPGWHHAFLRLIGENYRRLVVPQITALNIDTWTQEGQGGGMAKCYLTWDADFKWFDSDDMYVAVISGGLLGMSRRWWQETGGYDRQMMGWGGENLDQSLRMWLCGGEIVAASDSFVAHMWRTGDGRTSARYRHVGDASVNRARAVYAWYGEFADKLQHYPTFANRGSWNGKPWYGDLSNILEYRDRLKCRPFSWFLRRFKSIYEDAGLIPEKIFMLREEKTGLCLKYQGSAGTSGNGFGSARLQECGSESDHRFFWHLGNKNRRDGSCCSGLRAWNTDQCLTHVQGNKFHTGVCDVSGRNAGQSWAVTSSSRELRLRDECAGVEAGGSLVGKPCIALRNAGTRWTKTSLIVPLETQLYHKARQDHPETFARLDRELTASASANSGKPAACGRARGGCFFLYRPGSQECLDDSNQFTDNEASCMLFYAEGHTIKSAMEGSCLDRMNDASAETWGVYSCHGGENQRFSRSGDSYCDSADQCLRVKAA